MDHELLDTAPAPRVIGVFTDQFINSLEQGSPPGVERLQSQSCHRRISRDRHQAVKATLFERLNPLRLLDPSAVDELAVDVHPADRDESFPLHRKVSANGYIALGQVQAPQLVLRVEEI